MIFCFLTFDQFYITQKILKSNKIIIIDLNTFVKPHEFKVNIFIKKYIIIIIITIIIIILPGQFNKHRVWRFGPYHIKGTLTFQR